MNLEDEIFEGKSFGSLFKDIYNNHKKTQKQISELTNNLTEMVSEPGEAVMMVPLITTIIESGVKNDDALVKLANTAIKALDKKADAADNGELLSDKDKEQLFAEIKSIDFPKLPEITNVR
jgi:hypothetical protein